MELKRQIEEQSREIEELKKEIAELEEKEKITRDVLDANILVISEKMMKKFNNECLVFSLICCCVCLLFTHVLYLTGFNKISVIAGYVLCVITILVFVIGVVIKFLYWKNHKK
jgi:uncharacterized membrane protein YjjP (DUF1212 family)